MVVTQQRARLTCPLGAPPLVALLAGLVVLAGLVLALRRLARAADSRVLDPRTGADMAPPLPRWVPAVPA